MSSEQMCRFGNASWDSNVKVSVCCSHYKIWIQRYKKSEQEFRRDGQVFNHVFVEICTKLNLKLHGYEDAQRSGRSEDATLSS